MSVVPTSIAVQAELSGAGNGWADLSTDVRLSPNVTASYGIQGNTPNDRVAGAGTLTFALNNATTNSGGLLGYYSPDHANVRSGFAIGIAVRLAITYAGVTYYKFRGTLEDITPIPGQYGERSVLCTVLDWMDEAAKTKVRGVAAQVNQRSDQIFSTILANITRQPAASSIQTGRSTFGYALDNTSGQGIAVLEEFQRLALSEAGYIYQRGDTVQGGTLTFESRTTRATNNVAITTLAETMTGLTVKRSRANVINRVDVVTHPRTVDAAATTVLYSLPTGIDTMLMLPSAVRTVQAPYTNPSARADRIGGTAQVTPAATTDYTMNSAGDGSGSDLTTDFSVTATFGGDSAVLVLTNNGSVEGYITKLQVRGKGVYDTGEIVAEREDSASQTSYGLRTMTYAMPYQGDLDTADSAASYFLNQYKSPVTVTESVTFQGNYSSAQLIGALAREPGDAIAFSETVTGLTTATTYFINNVRLVVGPAKQLTCTWGLVPASVIGNWLIGTAGASEIGSTTTLGF